jgi:hypothetical protein
MLVFLTGFVYYCPFSLVSSPPLSCMNKYIVYTYSIQCVRGEYGVIVWRVPQTDKTPAAKSFTGQLF